MIYYIDNVDVGQISFEHQLKEDLSKIFGTKSPHLLQELVMDAVHNMTMTFEETEIGGRTYRILVHPIVFIEKPNYTFRGGVGVYTNPCANCLLRDTTGGCFTCPYNINRGNITITNAVSTEERFQNSGITDPSKCQVGHGTYNTSGHTIDPNSVAQQWETFTR